jgi:hypothetical protein
LVESPFRSDLDYRNWGDKQEFKEELQGLDKQGLGKTKKIIKKCRQKKYNRINIELLGFDRVKSSA